MEQFRKGMLQLIRNWKPILIFELLWKLITVLIIAPACAGLIQLAIRGAGLKFLTNSNLLRFLRSPLDNSGAAGCAAFCGTLHTV